MSLIFASRLSYASPSRPTDIAFEVARRDPHVLTFTLAGVPEDRLASASSVFLATLEAICSSPFDMIRMQARLREWHLNVLQDLETAPADRVLSGVTTDALYGNGRTLSFSTMWNDLDVIASLKDWAPQKWLRLLAAWFVDAHRLVMIGSPSSDLAHEQSEANAARVAARRRSLGPIGLAQLDKTLEEAKAVTTVPAPSTALRPFKVPSTSSIKIPPIETARSPGISGGQPGSLQASINKAGVSSPFFLQFDHYPSSFVSVCAFLCGSTSNVWPLFVSSFFAMPVQRASGETLSSTKAYQQLEDLAIGFDASTCSEGAVQETSYRELERLLIDRPFAGVLISIRVPAERYEEAVSWLADTIYGTRFDRKRYVAARERIREGLATHHRSSGSPISSRKPSAAFQTCCRTAWAWRPTLSLACVSTALREYPFVFRRSAPNDRSRGAFFQGRLVTDCFHDSQSRQNVPSTPSGRP